MTLGASRIQEADEEQAEKEAVEAVKRVEGAQGVSAALDLAGLFNGQGLLRKLIEVVVQNAIQEEFDRHIGAGRYERVAGGRKRRNGYKPRRMKTGAGEIALSIPQVREGGFFPSAFERYQRSDKALLSAMQEMVIQGVSTRRVSAVLEQLAGLEPSASTVSRAMAELDEEIGRWRNRALDEIAYRYLIIDARYEKVRVGGRVVSQAVLVAAGITAQGRREGLGFWVGDSESEATWGRVFADLKRRGMKGVEMVVSDAHAGIKAAMAHHMQGVAWQRCRVHLMRELIKKVSWKEAKGLAADLRTIFAGQDAAACRARAEEIAVKWEKRSRQMSAALRSGIEDCTTAKTLDPSLWRRLNSTNMLERLMRTLRQRTRVISIFPSIKACERMVGALLLDQHEQWLCEEARYLTLQPREETPAQPATT